MATNAQLADQLFRLIPAALNLTTQRLSKGLSIISGGRYGDLDEYFGENTVDKTKLLANIFNPALEDAAKNLGVDYITEETTGYDAILLQEQLENKLTLGQDTSSFATGNNHSKTKVDKVFVCKVQQVGNIFPRCFAAIVDLSLATNEATGWTDSVTKTGKNNNGFSKLQIHKDDAACITVIYGKIRSTTKFIHTEYETLAQ